MVEYIVVADSEGSDDAIELPTEDDGTLPLTTVQAQFPGALGLRYKGPSGKAWRGIKLLDEMLHPPEDGWSDRTYIITLPKSASNAPTASTKMEVDTPTTKPGESFVDSSKTDDLIVLGLSYDASESQVKTLFEQYGELELCEVKKDKKTGRSKGFAFIRFKDLNVCKIVMDKKHTIAGREIKVQRPSRQALDNPNKIFVGQIPLDTEMVDLRALFEQFGEISAFFMPEPNRGIAFIEYADQEDAAKVRNMDPAPKIKDTHLNIAFARKEHLQSATRKEQKKNRGGGRVGRGGYSGGEYGSYGGPRYYDLPRDYRGSRDFDDAIDYRGPRHFRGGPVDFHGSRRDFGYDNPYARFGPGYGGPLDYLPSTFNRGRRDR